MGGTPAGNDGHGQGGVDPLVLRALRLLEADDRRTRAAAGFWAAPVRLLARLWHSAGRGGAAEVDRLADRLMRDSRAHHDDLDAGIWGWSMYRDAARIALRLHAVALSGDDTGR